MRFTHVLTGLLAIFFASLAIGAPATPQTVADNFAVPGCMDVVNNDYYACQKRAKAMAVAGVEKTDAASMAQAWRIVCSFKDRESCEEAARIYTHGGPGLNPDMRIAANFHARACEFRSDDSCEAALDFFSRPGGNARDIRRLAFLYNDRCTQGSAQACEKGAFIVANGFGDRFSGVTNLALARTMAETGCKSGRSVNSCLLAEMLYGDSSLEGADAARSLTYAEMNCTAGEGASCLRLGAEAQRSENWTRAAGRYADACRLGSQAGCRHAAEAEKMKRYLAQQQEAKSGFLGALEAGDYAAATHAAIYVYQSKNHLAEAIRYIAGKRRMGSVPTNHLYVTALWFPSGDVFEAANREMRSRGTGLEGRFGGDTNAPGMAAARWQSAYSRGSSAYRASSSGTFTPSPMPSASEIASQTRQRYHHVNCVMSRIPNNPNC
ncbi:hypothetical protein [Croceicoccus naphthovorans]|nr:hypothetical protein [Croceicoccus naphthovorans]MBB3990269.1 hypothetical protein [Croceicoccus naphthovorans]